MTEQNHEWPSPASIRPASLHAQFHSLEAVDRELDQVGANVRPPRRDVPLDLSSVDEILSSILSPSMVRTALSVPAASSVDTTPSGASPQSIDPLPTPVVHATPVSVSIPAHQGSQPSSDQTVPASTLASSPTDEEEDIPRRFFDLDATTGDPLATILDVPDFLASETLVSVTLPTLLTAPGAVSSPTAQNTPPLLNDPTVLTESLALPATDLLFDATPEFLSALLDPTPSVPPEPLLIDEDDVVLEAAVTAPPTRVPERGLVDATRFADAPASATGTLLGVSAPPPRSIAPSPKHAESDAEALVFKLEPELNDAPIPPASRPVGVSERSDGRGPPTPSSRTLPRASGHTHNPPALPSQPPSRASSPSLRAAGSGKQPPPPPRPAQAAPPPAQRTAGALTTDDVEELDAQEVEIVASPSVPPPAADSKAPSPVAERLPGQK